MKNIYFILIISLLSIISSCNSSSESQNASFTIQGQLSQISGKMLFLEKTGDFAQKIIDSCYVEANGNFLLKGESTYADIYVLYTDKSNYTFLLLEPGQDVGLNGDGSQLDRALEVKGSAGTADLFELKRKNRNLLAAIDSLKLDLNRSEVNYENRLKETEKAANAMVGRYTDDLKAYITENSSSLTAIAALHQRLGKQRLISFENDAALFYLVDSALMAKYPENYHVKDFHNNLLKMEQEARDLRNAQATLGVGALAPELDFPDPSGKSIKLSSLKGKYVLIDFWASWCSPCRAESPNLVKAYAKYHSKGFEIYQLSLDKQKDKWVEAIKEDQLDWPYHVSDLLYWKSAGARLYQVNSIPANFLINPEGVIIARDLRGEALEEELAKIFGI